MLRQRHRPHLLKVKQSGQSATEFIIIAPVIFMLIFGCLQFALVYQAKTTLTYATFMAARTGSVEHASLSSVMRGFSIGMAPFFATDADPFGVPVAVNKVKNLIAKGHVRFERLNPTSMAFLEYGIHKTYCVGGIERASHFIRGLPCDSVWLAIPNDTLMYRDATTGSSRVSIQDANLFKLRVTFCYHLSFPIIRVVVRDMVKKYSIGHQLLDCAASTRDEFTIPITSTAIVRMQSDAIQDPAWNMWPYR